MKNIKFFTKIISAIAVISWISFYWQLFTEATSFTLWNGFICLGLTALVLAMYKIKE